MVGGPVPGVGYVPSGATGPMGPNGYHTPTVTPCFGCYRCC
jgi:hypothetical protein